ncbi:MAG: threonylcarbamoyl-AMP synthase [Gammaproteobacteria bacterium]|nr:threonylcarbamoyl-AMP synthase [Gammaproteobacteria bacterium]
MSQFFEIHPDNPQKRLIHRAVEILREGAVIAYPTDSSYALGCMIGDKSAMETIRRIRRLDDKHNFTLMCRDLSEIATYAKVDNSAFRLLKAHTPGPYTFIFKATHEVPRRLQHAKRRTIGIRIPNHPIAQALLEDLGEPLMSTTLILPGEDLPEVDPHAIRDRLEHELGLVIDGGGCSPEPTTVLDMTEGAPQLVRAGLGVVEAFI